MTEESRSDSAVADNDGVALDQISIRLTADDILGLHVLASLDGVAESDSDAFLETASFTLREGVLARLAKAGLPWPPTPDSVMTAKSIAESASAPEPVSTSQERTHAIENDPATAGARVASVWSRPPARKAGVAALTIAITTVIVGGYAGHWRWTGFEANGQVWDWLHLLLLPLAFGTLPLWLRYSGHMSARRRQVFATLLMATLSFILAAYLAPLIWSGFQGQTLWNWLTLIVLPATLITVRAWPTEGRPLRPTHKVVASAIVTGWIVTLIGGYALGWNWTGYQSNTLWDWLQLLLAPLAINTFVIPKLVVFVSGHAAELAEAEQARLSRERALEAARKRWVHPPSA
jgi:hypothetical protein